MAQMPLVGDEFAGYRLLAILGRGGMSVVYEAENIRLGSIVAVKVMPPELASDDVFRARFLKESRTAASLRHPNIIPIFDMGGADNLLYIAMRYVAGSDLRKILQQRHHLPPEEALYITSQVGRALDYAHKHGLIHRDVKPANVLIERGVDEEDLDHVFLADFGITKHETSQTDLTPAGQFVGTLDYIAPEQIRGKAMDGRSDIYSLGCVFFEALTGQVPFTKGLDAAMLYAHLEESVPRPSELRPELPSALDEVVSTAMAKHPDDRFSTCREFVTAARAALNKHDRRQATTVSRRASPEPPPGQVGPAQPPGSPARYRPPWSDDPAPALAATGSAPAAEPPPNPGSGRRSKSKSRTAAMVSAVVLAAALIAAGLWLGLRHGSTPAASTNDGGTPSSPTPTPTASSTLGPLAQVIQAAAPHGYLPWNTCHQVTMSHVKCDAPATGAHAVDFRTYRSLGDLYRAYLGEIARLNASLQPHYRVRPNTRNCTLVGSDGELSWNHFAKHSTQYSIQDLVSGNLDPDTQAAGRVFCHNSNDGSQVILWTDNDLMLLGEVNGTGYNHPETFTWWRAVHHSVAEGMGPNMTMSPDAAPRSSPAMSH